MLADPGTGGFNKALWLVPIALALLAAVGVVFALKRWRRRTPATLEEVELPPELSAEDAARLDRELAR